MEQDPYVVFHALLDYWKLRKPSRNTGICKDEFPNEVSCEFVTNSGSGNICHIHCKHKVVVFRHSHEVFHVLAFSQHCHTFDYRSDKS